MEVIGADPFLSVQGALNLSNKVKYVKSNKEIFRNLRLYHSTRSAYSRNKGYDKRRRYQDNEEERPHYELRKRRSC